MPKVEAVVEGTALSSAPETQVPVDTDNKTTPAVDYLRGKLAGRDGYLMFVAHRSHVLANPDMVKDWQFAVDFTREYDKQRSPEVNSSIHVYRAYSPNSLPQKITKASIQKALGIGSSWMGLAQTGVEIIGTHGHEKEVKEVLERTDNPPAGATALLDFLVELRKNHPKAPYGGMSVNESSTS